MGEWVHYRVILREGVNAGLEQTFSVFKKKVSRIFSRFRFGDDGSAYLAHIAGNDTKHGELQDMMHYDKKCLSSLVFDCKNKETANKCVGYWGILQPFVNNN